MTNLPSITSIRPRDALRFLPMLLAIVLVAYAAFAGGHFASVAGFALIYAIFVTGLNIFMGLAGQASFGQNAFAAIGGYSSAYLTTSYDLPPLAAMAFGIVAAMLVAAIIGIPTLRLKGHYLAMGTLSIGLIVYEITVQWQSVTQGYMGISGIPPMGIGKWEIYGDRPQLIFLSLVVAAAMLSAYLIRQSRFGRALVGLSGSEDAARAMGIAVTRYKIAAFVLSAAYAAIAGSLMVHLVGFVSPEVFGLYMVILGFMMIYVGGIGTVTGPLVGAVVVSLLPESFRAFKDYQDLIYGAALIVILIFAPGGLASIGALVRRKSAETNDKDASAPHAERTP